MKTRFPEILPTLLIGIAAGALTVCPAVGATDFWVGGSSDNNWNNGANWLSASPPNSFDSLVFTNQMGAAETSSNDFTAAAFDGITFSNSATASPLILNGNGILLSGQTNGITIGITNTTTLAETVSNNLTLDWGYYNFNGGPGTLALDGTITPNTGGMAYFGSGVTSASFTTDASGLISGLGGAGLMTNSSGGVSVLAAVSGGSVVPYTFPAAAKIASGVIPTNGISGTNIDLTATASTTYTFPNGAGTLYVGSLESDNTANTTTISWGSGTTPTNLVIGVPSNIGVIYTPNTTTAQRITVGQGNGSYLTAGPMNGAAGPGEVIFAINGSNTSNEGENNANVVDNASGGHVTVVKAGNGSMYFNNTNGYSGGTYVDQGYLQVNNAAGIGTGPVYVASGAEIYLQAAGGNWLNTMNISPGAGPSYNLNGEIKIGNGANTQTMSGTLNLMGKPVTTTPGDMIGGTGNGGIVQISGQITGAGTLELDDLAGSSDSVTVNLTNATPNANNWTGGMLINTAGSANSSIFVKDMIPNQLNGNNVTIADNGTGTSRYDLDSQNDTIGTLNSGFPGTGNIEVDNAESGTSTLAVGANNASGGSFGGNIGLAGASINIVKIGTGKQTFNGTNVYTGSTTISNGVLTLGTGGMVSDTTPINVVSGGTFDVSELVNPFVLNAGQTLSGFGGVVTGVVTFASSSEALISSSQNLNLSNNVTFNGGSTNYYALTTPGANGAIVIPNQATFNGVTTIYVNYSTLPSGTYVLIKYGSSSPSQPVEGGNLVLGGYTPSGRGQTATLNDTAVAGQLELVVSGTPAASLTWVGNGVNNNWDVQSTEDWSNNATTLPDYFYQADIVTFNDSGSATPAVNLVGSLTPGLTTVSNNAKAYSFSGSGSLGGNAALLKQGTGSLTLWESGGDTFNGVVMNGGTLVMSNNSSSITGITVNGGNATVGYSGTVAGSLTANGGSVTYVGSGNLGGGITANNSGTTLLLDQTSTPGGALSIGTGASVQVGNNDANGTLPANSAGQITDNGALVFNRNDTALDITTNIAGSGSVTNNGTGTVTFGSGTGGQGSSQTYTGPTVVNAGTLSLDGGNNGNSGPYKSSKIVINANATVIVDLDNSLTGSGGNAVPIFVNAGGTLTGNGSADAGLGTSSHISGALTLNGGTLAMNGTSVAPAEGSWDLNGGVVVGNPPSPITSTISALSVGLQESPTTFAVTNGGTASGVDLLVSGQLAHLTSQTDHPLVKTGNGTMCFDNPTNTYADGTLISSGTIQLGTPGDTAPLTPTGPPAGSIMGTGPVTNNAALSFASSQEVELTNIITSTAAGGSIVVDSGEALLAAPGPELCANNVLVQGGTLALSGVSTLPNSPQINVNNATFDTTALTVIPTNSIISLTNATLNYFIQNAGVTNNVVSQAVTNLNLGGTANHINIESLPQAFITSYPVHIHLISYKTLNAAVTNIVLGTLPPVTPAFGGYLTNNTTAGTFDLVLTTGPAPARQLNWTGTDPSNPTYWDVATSFNWVTNGGVTPTTYNQFDSVTFNDSATGQTNINVTTIVTPGSVTVSNRVLQYTFNGSGSISNATGLLKEGTNILVVDENNAYSGGTTISGGILQLGNADLNGSLGSGIVVDNGALVFDRPYNDIFSNSISGGGTIVEEGNDTLQLAGVSTFGGSTLVTSNSTLQLGAYNSLGTAVTTVNTNSTLDINGYTASGSIVAQGSGTDGSGAINDRSSTTAGFQTGGVDYVGVTNLTLSGNLTLGATGARWDLRSPGGTAGNPATAALSTGGQPYNITKVGSQFIGIVSATVDTNLANIDIQNGTFEMEGNSTCLGNPTNTVTVEGTLFGNNTIFQLFAITNQLNKVILVNDGGTIQAANGNVTIIGPVTFTNSSSSATPECGVNVSAGTLTLAGQIYGNGILYQDDATSGTNALILAGADTNFAGSVVLDAGRLIVNNILDTVGGVTVNFGTYLAVDGIIGGSGVTNSDGTVSGSGVISNILDNSAIVEPGTATAPATLTVDSLILESSSTETFNLNYNNTVGGGANDLIAVKGNLNVIGGTININPVSSVLQDGLPYTLITYTGTCNLPVGQVTALGINGVDGYSFVINNTGSAITITASGGPPIWNGGGSPDNYWDDSANWSTPLTGNDPLAFAGNVGVNNTNDLPTETAQAIVFIPGAGAFTLNPSNGIPLTLNGNIINNSIATQTVDLPLDLGSAVTFNGADALLNVLGGLTNTASAFTTVTLAGQGTLSDQIGDSAAGTNVLLLNSTSANWTIANNAAGTPVTAPCNIQIQSGTLNYGTLTSAPNFTSTTPNGAPSDTILGMLAGQTATLNMSNGVLTLASRLDTGASVATATGIVNQVAGIITINGQLQGANIGNGVSYLNISGGTNNVVGNTLFVASRGIGYLNLSGSGVVNAGTIDVSRDAQGATLSSFGTINLNGGMLSCTSINTATANSATGASPGATGTINFNGGTLVAAAGAAATFITDSATEPVPLAAFVLGGGAIINDGGQSIAINENMQSGVANDGGLTKLGTGTLTLNKTNTYNGPTVISAGTLALAATGTLSNSVAISIAGGATFSVTALASPLTLGSIQTLSNSTSTATIAGSLNTGSGTVLLAYASGTPSMSVSSGTLTLSSATMVTVNNTGAALPAGTYTIIANGGGTVASSGTLPSVTVTGGGVTAGQSVSLQISSGSLNLVVGSLASPAHITSISVHGPTLTITATNGADSGQFVLLESTNLLKPIAQWTPVLTNSFDNSGDLNLSTNIVSSNNPEMFYLLQMP